MTEFTKYHPFYAAWCNLRQRCDNPLKHNYEYYGGRGITYSERWKSFTNFKEDMYPTWRKGLTLDRIDKNGPYCKENCRWATWQEQNDNKRDYKLAVDNKSGLTNVYWNRRKRKWYAQAFENKRRIHLHASVDFFEVCCARKSWEAKHAS
jgi:hypothetical protein